MKKQISVMLRLLVTAACIVAGVHLLYRYEYLANLHAVDNVVGMVPVVLVFVFIIGTIYLLWFRQQKQQRPVTVTVALLVLLSVILFPTALRGNWWLNTVVSNTTEAAPDLSVYQPFSEGSKAVTLDGKASLQLSGDLPVMDGATALYPVYAAFAQAVYDRDRFSQQEVRCTNTRGAYESLIAGENDVIFVAGASDKQLAAAKEAGAELVFTPIGYEAFVFIVGNDNPVENLSYQQLRNIYSGKTAYWNTLGWDKGGKIIAYQRPEGSGSQTGLQRIMGTLPIQVPQPLPDPSLVGTNSLMKQVSVTWNGVQPALGYSYRYYATTMYANPDTKLLKIDGVYPSIEQIQNKSYPFVANFYAVTKGEPQGNTKLLIDWILSPQGQEIIGKTGYTPLMPVRS